MLKKTTPKSATPKPTANLKPQQPSAGPGNIANALQAELQKRGKATRGKESGKCSLGLFFFFSPSYANYLDDDESDDDEWN